MTLGLTGIPAMGSITPPSISLEGNRLWILKAAPVASRTILEAKLTLSLLVVLPTVAVAAAGTIVATGASLPEAVMAFLVPALATVAVSEIGLLAGLFWPKLDAANDTVVIKQSLSVTVSLFVGLGLIALAVFAALYAAKALGATGGMILLTAMFALVAVLLWFALRSWGARTLDRLA